MVGKVTSKSARVALRADKDLKARPQSEATQHDIDSLQLYDSVPGRTGYLHQLLAQDATTLVDVFKQALEAITHCPCNLEAEKNACYRCVYQYRQG